MKAGGREEETVYRDATGRRVDVSMRRAEARRAAAEAEEREKERQAKIAPKGDVQAAAAKARREALEDAKTMAFARGADDDDMNREMKGKERWNDPMAQFMQTDTATTTTGGKAKKGKNRPIYTGGAPPNRYGIRPGYRWDGVDRSNGFEGERFKAINRRERNKGLDYSWQMDE
ncbi:Pre-mRNA-splicing factor cwc-26 like protein [Verticillium longisporum]|nr:Pre-mRNA-splicing factor cwc-26 like protein [Verticillium longisporum]